MDSNSNNADRNPSGDFVFEDDGKGGLRFKGDFEGLYREQADPWDQSGYGAGKDRALNLYYHRSRRWLFDVINGFAPGGGYGLEVGSGLGYLTMSLERQTVVGDWFGVEVSREAVDKARALHKGDGRLRFHQGDVTAGDWGANGPLLGVSAEFDVVLLSEVLWYVIEKIEVTIANAWSALAPGGLLIISQGFMPEGQQRFIPKGWEPGWLGFIDGMVARFQPFGGPMRLPLPMVDLYDDRALGLPLHHGLVAFRKPAA